ncbi:MAG: hypothetical protein KatS3mg033_1475 [Thermonema sp.]|uniref:hypothetical protein n=1 Tax=Thermonema sp. TaxID=2231181 RepID=UPI0021DBE648|nr:hypothetical protein [Thermonema sp.]GIV39675.1 MAG: hypothetical protein KatS3mg033_1475 [Thermonema sp.]
MKKLLYLFLIVVAGTFMACSGEKREENSTADSLSATTAAPEVSSSEMQEKAGEAEIDSSSTSNAEEVEVKVVDETEVETP